MMFEIYINKKIYRNIFYSKISIFAIECIKIIKHYSNQLRIIP